MRTKFKVVTLCGSTRFKAAFYEWHARLELEGNLIFTVAMWSNFKQIEPTPEQKELMDAIHKQKICMSNEIFVLDVDGYIGESTRSEIEFAENLGVKVRYLSKEYPKWNEFDCIYFDFKIK